MAVLGAGPAGAACTLALAGAGVSSVWLIGGVRPERSKIAVGETIPPDTSVLLDRLGLWSAFLDEGHEPCPGSCSSWGSLALGYNDFVLNPRGSGWHLDRARFDGFLRRHAASSGATVLNDARFVSASTDDDDGYSLRVATRGGAYRNLRARLVIDATGRSSAFARWAGARRMPLDRLMFVYGYFDAAGATSTSRLTLLEAAPRGWWYAARLPGERLAVAFATDADEVRTAGLTSEPRWLRAALATSHLGPRLDGCRLLHGTLTVRVASSFVLDRPGGPRWLAVGDAAASLDPLSGQGIYQALADGIEGAQLVTTALARGRHLPDGHGESVRSRFDEYLVNRNYFYGLEQRWPTEAFWQRRHLRSAPSAA